jgi:uncharacterized protein YgfB (UPF0149 family)
MQSRSIEIPSIWCDPALTMHKINYDKRAGSDNIAVSKRVPGDKQMPVLQLPDFDQTLAISSGSLDALELSECHGAVCGLLCRNPSSQSDSFFSLLSSLELLKDPDEALKGQLSDLHFATASQLDDEQLRFSIWLPDDDESLDDRTEALAHWCTGFLAGLANGHDLELETLSEDVSAALADLEQIARAQMTGEGDAEEEESAFTEIVEYIRVVTLMMREELSPAKPQDLLH